MVASAEFPQCIATWSHVRDQEAASVASNGPYLDCTAAHAASCNTLAFIGGMR
jgi:hypothetical protein